jgi:hypothetical protein
MINLMKRLQIMIDEDLDEALDHQARKERTSKAALIRRFVRERIKPLPPIEKDPLWDFFGGSAGSRSDSESVDDVVYPR